MFFCFCWRFVLIRVSVYLRFYVLELMKIKFGYYLKFFLLFVMFSFVTYSVSLGYMSALF